MVPIEIRRHRPEEPWTYALKDRRQREVAARARRGEPGALLLSEVAPIVTRGRRTAAGDLLLPAAQLNAQGVELHETDRGGLATYHGPGQWVLFAVDRLDRLTGDRRGVRKAVEGLLEIALEVGRRYEPRAEIRDGCETGVWTPRGKFAAVGVHIEQGVLLHGLAVNAYRTPTSFLGIRPCGLDAPVDFLLGSNVLDHEFEALGQRLIEAALDRFWSRRPLTEPERPSYTLTL